MNRIVLTPIRTNDPIRGDDPIRGGDLIRGGDPIRDGDPIRTGDVGGSHSLHPNRTDQAVVNRSES